MKLMKERMSHQGHRAGGRFVEMFTQVYWKLMKQSPLTNMIMVTMTNDRIGCVSMTLNTAALTTKDISHAAGRKRESSAHLWIFQARAELDRCSDAATIAPSD